MGAMDLLGFTLAELLIIFFLKNNSVKLEQYDKILIILSGFILILLIDYIEVINILLNKHIKDPRCSNDS
jgi:hypothetical protein